MTTRSFVAPNEQIERVSGTGRGRRRRRRSDRSNQRPISAVNSEFKPLETRRGVRAEATRAEPSQRRPEASERSKSGVQFTFTLESSWLSSAVPGALHSVYATERGYTRRARHATQEATRHGAIASGEQRARARHSAERVQTPAPRRREGPFEPKPIVH
jgi:hypothetical protein